MPSLIKGYEYDIFISYRQKDNKADKWVTHFVEALKDEIEATFKEDISIYFDENPHDGLLETHDVDHSLSEKIKVLVLIPIISQTYCDPNCFAWQKEFIAFRDFAREDKLGLDIRLVSGNVCKRILPVRIHEIDVTDQQLYEKETGGVMRPIDFIYKASGVNRPLRPDEDNPHNNLNKTFYRDQINKVANAIKEIISGRAGANQNDDYFLDKDSNALSSETNEPDDTHRIGFKWKKPINIITLVSFIGIIIIISIYVFHIFNKNRFEDIRDVDGRISVAVMPFQNLSGDTLFDIWQEGIQNLLITSLSNSEELSVRQYETMHGIFRSKESVNYSSITPSFASDIALKLEANTVIVGNIHKSGNIVRITANLLDSKSEEIYKSYQIEGVSENDFFTITDSLSALVKNYLEIKKIDQSMFFDDLKNVFTKSTIAYKYYIQGYSYHGQLNYNSAIEFYTKAINIDTNFVSAMLKLSYVYGDLGQTDLSKKWAYKAYSKIDNLPVDIQLSIKEVKSAIDKRPLDQINYMEQYLKINPYCMNKMYGIGWACFNTEQWNKAIDAFEKNIKLYKKFDRKSWIWTYILLGRAYHETGEHKKESKIFEDAISYWPNAKIQITHLQAMCALSQGNKIKANEYLDEFSAIGRQNDWSESEILYWLANAYEQTNDFKQAEKLYRHALAIAPQYLDLINDFAYFLISNEINIDEGSKLIHGVLEKRPDNGNYLYTYGLGLYKQGKPKEALEVLNKAWDLIPYYDHDHFVHIKEVEEAL